ncbi:MAG: lipopolysaccharide biosynthesis protein [Oscillospiraceae bacterium]|nr:lipopolysaccharide biosynthesis protein [Oscillospiraceae bacterium]
MIWRFAERSGAQTVSFIVSIVLARLLSPDMYGTIALIMVFTNILQVFIDSGMGSALIQKKDADDTEFSSVFYFNCAVCVAIYFILICAAPVIAKFYNDTALVAYIRVIGILLLISGVKNIQQAYVSKHMMFKRFFYSTLGGTIISAFVGITMAYYNFGCWAIIAQYLTNAFIDTLVLWITVKWRPSLAFSPARLKGLYSYGWKLLCSSLLDTVYNNLRNLIIGKMYTKQELAFYDKGNQFPMTIITNINTSIDSVLLPVMSEEQNNKDNVKNIVRKSIELSTYVIAPLMMGLIAISDSVVRIVLTDKWIECVPYMRIFCISYIFYPIHTANLNAIKALGRSDLFLKLEIIKKAVGLVLLLISMHYGVMVMAYSTLISGVAAQIINSWPNKKLLGYSYIEQIKDIMPNLLLAVLMGGLVIIFDFFDMPILLKMIIQVLTGIAIYVILSAAVKNRSFVYIKNIALKRK